MFIGLFYMRSVKWLIMNMMGSTCKEELITMLELEIILAMFLNNIIFFSPVSIGCKREKFISWKNTKNKNLFTKIAARGINQFVKDCKFSL